MRKLKYLITRVNKGTLKRIKEVVGRVKRINNKSSLAIFIDMMYCSIKYGAGPSDYYAFGMYNLNPNERRTILTRGKNNTLVKKFNPKEYWHIFDNKNEFNETFNKYLHRDWLYFKSMKELTSFVEKHKTFIAKPNSDSGGNGIEKVSVDDFKSVKQLYNYLCKKNLLLIEEIIKQHDTLSKLNPSSVNTIRIITLLYNNKVNLITAFLRIGNNNSFVDNTCSGGMLSIIDMKRGVLLYPGVDALINIYEVHPITNVKIKGIKIPYFDEAKKLVKELALIIPDVKYIAWDIAITNDGPVVIEGNPYPGYYYQFPPHMPNNIGIMPVFEDIINNND